MAEKLSHIELIQHLANLTFLIDFHTKLGGPANRWILKEFDTHNEELIKGLKEKYDETRPSNVKYVKPEDGTKLSRS